MKALKIWRIAFVMVVTASFASCNSDDDDKGYSPAYYSATFNEVKMLLTDGNGNDLASSNDVLSSVNIHGDLSGKDVPLTTVKIDGITHVRFNADLPDERKMEYNANKTAGKGTSTMTLTVGKQTARLVFTFEATSNDAAEGTIGKNSIRITGIQLGNKAVTRERDSDIVLPIAIGNGELAITESLPIPQEKSITTFSAIAASKGKTYLGSGYDVTGAYLSEHCLRENVVDLTKMSNGSISKIAAYSSSGSLEGSMGDARSFLEGLNKGEEFTQEGEPDDVYFCGTFTENPLFKEVQERGNEYAFMMYMETYVVYSHKMLLRNRQIERVLTEEFKQAIATESAERIVERFGTHVLKQAMMGLNAQFLYRTGLKANINDGERFLGSMFRCINEVYSPVSWQTNKQNATRGGTLSVQLHGGDTQGLYTQISEQKTDEEMAQAIANWWHSPIDDDNLTLALLRGEDLVPIYQLIPDETKRAEVQRAVKAYIHSHQLK